MAVVLERKPRGFRAALAYEQEKVAAALTEIVNKSFTLASR
jgi:hypothetical protein